MDAATHNHNQLVMAAEKWLRRRCGVVFTEYACRTSEIPDALGFHSRRTMLVECKVSRADFFADGKKAHAMGNYRYYLVPTGLVTAEEVPAGWGLLYYRCGRIAVAKRSSLFTDARAGEYPIVYSLLRRMELRGLLNAAREPLE